MGLIVGLALAAGAFAADYDRGLDAAARGDLQTAWREFSALAAEGHPDAQYSLAMLYLKSDPPQYERAIPWLEAAARAAVPDAQYMLGLLALYGVGMPRDAEQGLQWLRMAGHQGYADAQAKLAELERARLREAERARRKSERAGNLQVELEKARATEVALKARLEKSREREQRLAREQESLKNARARDVETKAKLQRERERLERELAELQALLAEAERLRQTERAPAAPAPAQAPAPAPTMASAGVGPSLFDSGESEAIVSGKVAEILPDGVLLTNVSRRVDGRDEAFPEDFVVFLAVAGSDSLIEGQKVIYPVEPTTPYRYRLESGATGRIRAYRVLAE